MTKQSLIVASLGMALGLALAPAYAQDGGVHAEVPFNFVAFGKTFPAGEYTMIPSSNQIKIRNADGRAVAVVLAVPGPGRSDSANGEIVFHCYRERCFLAEVWSPARENGRQVPTSSTEAELAKKETGKYFAVVGVNRRSSRTV